MFTQLLFNLPLPDPEPEPDPEPDTDPEPEPTGKRTTVIAWLKVMSEIQWNLPAGFHIRFFEKRKKTSVTPPPTKRPCLRITNVLAARIYHWKILGVFNR